VPEKNQATVDVQFQNYINVKLIDLWVDAYLSAVKGGITNDPKRVADQAAADFKSFLASGE